MGDIRTDYWRKPIPTDRFDWEAWVDGREERYGTGFGRTREDAVADLMERAESCDPHPGELAALRAEVARMKERGCDEETVCHAPSRRHRRQPVVLAVRH